MKIGHFIVRVFEDGRRLDLAKDSSKTLPLLPIVDGSPYDPRVYNSTRTKVFPETGSAQKTRVAAINFIIDLFEGVAQATIMERYDIRLTPYGYIDRAKREKSSSPNKHLLYPYSQEYFLVHVDGKPYLTGENFGQIFIPLGAESADFSQQKYDDKGSIERAFASALLANANINEDGLTPIHFMGVKRPGFRDEFSASYMDIRARFILTGGKMEDFPQRLTDLREQGWLDFDEAAVVKKGAPSPSIINPYVLGQQTRAPQHLPNPITTVLKMKPFSWHPSIIKMEG